MADVFVYAEGMMGIPRFTVPYIFWRSRVVYYKHKTTYETHKICITGGTWLSGKYLKADAPPNYPVPVTLDVSDIATNWSLISFCQCDVCLDKYMDGLEVDFPDAFV